MRSLDGGGQLVHQEEISGQYKRPFEESPFQEKTEDSARTNVWILMSQSVNGGGRLGYTAASSLRKDCIIPLAKSVVCRLLRPSFLHGESRWVFRGSLCRGVLL
jgi:hypothetical protein